MTRALLPVLLLPACATPSPRPGAPGGDSGGGADTAAACDAWGFGPVERWPLPALPNGATLRDVADPSCSGEDDALVRLTDQTGDGVPDLVVFGDCARETGVGDDHWLVYAGTGAGWAEEAVRYTLPSAPSAYAWARPRDLLCDGAGDVQYSVTDWDRDGVDDIVVLDDCDDATPLGAGVWRVHRGGPTGFDLDGVAVTLPDRGLSDRWSPSPEDECRPDDPTPLHGWTDFDDDGLTDLVLIADCGSDPGLGTTTWAFVPGMGNGFDLARTTALPLPDIGAERAFTGRYGVACPTPDHVRYRLLDVDLDDVSDLLVTSRCDDAAEPGGATWIWYPGAHAAGFLDEPRTLDLPDVEGEAVWAALGGFSCDEGGPALVAFDELDGDDDPELALRARCDGEGPAGLGTETWVFWDLLPGGAFGPPRTWSLPVDAEADAWLALRDDACGHPGDALYTSLDIDGDEVRDVVITYGCDTDGPLGAVEWGVRRGGCRSGGR